MSHLRDIQKLRQTRNTGQTGYTARFSQPNTTHFSLISEQHEERNNSMQQEMDFKSSYTPRVDIQPRKWLDPLSKYQRAKELPRTREGTSSHRRAGSINQLQLKELQQHPGSSIHHININTQRTLPVRRDKIYELHTNGTPRDVSHKVELVSKFIEKDPASYWESLAREHNNRLDLTLRHKIQLESRIYREPYIGSICRSDFEVMYPVGKGGFGKVWKVQRRKSKEIYAMKQMQKAKIIHKKSIGSVMNERMLLARARHPFLINMTCAFQDREHLYLCMDYLNGGDLRYHLGKRRRFTQVESKFFVASLIVGLEYLHSQRIIHRDIKPENLVFDGNGYLRITDLGISRELRDENANDTSGTPGYMAPEVMCRRNHGYCVDFFATGVMTYEFMFGRRPYVGANRKEIREQILSRQVVVRPEDEPNRWSLQAADFINRLIQRNPASRLGYNGIEQIKQHEWLRGIDWVKLQRKQLQAPYIPKCIEDNYDDYKEQISQDTVDDSPEEKQLMLRDKNVQSLFEGYYFEESTHRKTSGQDRGK